MNELAQRRINFLEHLHGAFLKKTGHGAFASMTISEAMSLFDTFTNSGESRELFINRIINAIA